MKVRIEKKKVIGIIGEVVWTICFIIEVVWTVCFFGGLACLVMHVGYLWMISGLAMETYVPENGVFCGFNDFNEKYPMWKNIDWYFLYSFLLGLILFPVILFLKPVDKETEDFILKLPPL